MFDKQLIRKINNGRCLVLVGSGPSCEVGYPSWGNLAKLAYENLTALDIVSDFQSYEKYLHKKEYPQFFRQVERDLGDDRNALITFLKPLLIPPNKTHGYLYDLLSKWPFACYLTTNYDNEINEYLSNLNEHFEVIRNRPQDFILWRDGVSHIIQKLHSDLDHPEEVILTSADYKRLQTDGSAGYFRDRLCSIFAMFDVLIVGHSLSDPDIDTILNMAKRSGDPCHPIYLIAADFTEADEKELLEQYNIVLVQYSNSDGRHSKLIQMLRTMDHFIVSRDRRVESRARKVTSDKEVEAAIALSLYRRLQGVQPGDYLSPLILSQLNAVDSGRLALDAISSSFVLENITEPPTQYGEAIEETIKSLRAQGLLKATADQIHITEAGREKVQEYHAIRESEKDQAYGQFQLTLKGFYKEVDESQIAECQRFAEEVLVENFSKRGLVIANNIYSGQTARPDELSDVFGYVSDKAVKIEDLRLQSAFVEAVYQFIVEPNPPQRNYLASVSQGYFLYHLLGLDPKCGEVRRDIFRKTLWLCDSSIILPLVATACHNHDYAVDLFSSFAHEEALLCTTSNLLREAWDHFKWALRFVERYPTDSLDFLRAATVRGSYKQNLFLDGYIRLSADGDIGTFSDYVKLLFPSGDIDRVAFEDNITKKGVQVVRISELTGFDQADLGDIEYYKTEVQKAREKSGTYRSPLQVESEAEILVLLRNLRSRKYSVDGLENAEQFYFISQSRIIERVSQEQTVTTWSPEAIYRYLSALSPKQISADLLQQCMLHEYFYAGISFIDKKRYEHFFGPSINAAKTSFQMERNNYVADLEDTFARNVDEIFEQTPDLDKPFFSAQMGWHRARQSERREALAMRRAGEAEEQVKKLESEKEKAWRTREKRVQEQLEARLRNLQDPKHLRKRRRQTKKRKQKKN